MKILRLSLLLVSSVMIFLFGNSYVQACSRVVYIGADSLVVTGRNMDWQEDMHSNIFIMPRGVERRGSLIQNTMVWKAKYGSIITSSYDMGCSDGLNEKGLDANLLFLSESDYSRKNDSRPAMNIGLWAQYVLDNFATVHEAVEALSKEEFRIEAPNMPGGSKTTIHMSISDAIGNSAILEYIDGNLVIHEGKEYQVMTNSPIFEKQLAITEYWNWVGGVNMLPGTGRSSDRFARAAYYLKAVKKTADPKLAAAYVMSIMRNVSAPMDLSTPEKKKSATQWRVLADQKNLIYYFDSAVTLNTFHVELKDLDFAEGTPYKELKLSEGQVYPNNATKAFVKVPPVDFLKAQAALMKKLGRTE